MADQFEAEPQEPAFGEAADEEEEEEEEKSSVGQPSRGASALMGQPWELSPSDEAFLKFYSVGADLQAQFGVQLDATEFMLVGVQSAGKSSVLSQLTMMPVSFIQSQTGTRCPVRYTLRYDRSRKTPLVRLDGEVIASPEMLPERLHHIMDHIQQSVGFSEEPVQVEITSDRTPFMVVVDLPGFITEGAKQERERDAHVIREMARHYLEDDYGGGGGRRRGKFKHTPLVVVKADDAETIVAFDIIGKLCRHKRPRWQQDAVVVLNKFEKYAKDSFSSAADVVAYFETVEKSVVRGRLVATSMNPLEKVLAAPGPHFRTHDEVRAYLREVGQHEQRIMDELFEPLQRTCKSDEERGRLKEIRADMVGIRCMRGRVREVTKANARAMARSWQGIVDAQRDKRAKVVQEKDSILKRCDPGVLKSDVSAFCEQLFSLLQAFYDGRDLGADVEQKEREEDWCAILQRVTWEEDMAEFSNWLDSLGPEEGEANGVRDALLWRSKYYLDPAELEEQIRQRGDANAVAYYVEDGMLRRLNGRAQMLRALRLWEVMVCLSPFVQPDRDVVLNWLGGLEHCMEGDINRGIRLVLEQVTHPFEFAYGWLASYMQFLFGRHVDMAFAFLLHHKAPNERSFVHLRRKEYREVLEELLDNYKRKLRAYAADFRDSAKYDRKDACAIYNEHVVPSFVETVEVLRHTREDELKNWQQLTGAPAPQAGQGGGGGGGGDSKPVAQRWFQATNQVGIVAYPNADGVAQVLMHSMEAFKLIKWQLLQIVCNKAKSRVTAKVMKGSADLRQATRTGALDYETQCSVNELAEAFGMAPGQFQTHMEVVLGISMRKGFSLEDSDDIAKRCGFDVKAMREELAEVEEELAEFNSRVAEAKKQLDEMSALLGRRGTTMSLRRPVRVTMARRGSRRPAEQLSSDESGENDDEGTPSTIRSQTRSWEPV